MRDAVLFDLDGTLVDSAVAIAAALNAMCIDRGLGPVNIASVREWVALGAEQLVARALRIAEPASTVDLAEFRARLSEVPADPAMIYRGVSDMLEGLLETGSRCAIVTNKPEALSRQLLDDLALSRFFATVIGGDSAARPKPSPDPLIMALVQIGCSRENASFVGDSRIDAAVAQACALPFFLFTRGYGASECDDMAVKARFSEHAELPALLRS